MRSILGMPSDDLPPNRRGRAFHEKEGSITVSEYTPMMQQYIDTKKDYKDCILFYRLGDFYEMFFADLELRSSEP